MVAAGFFLLAERIAGSAANGLSSGDWKELIYRFILLFVLLLGFWAMGYIFQRQRTPLRSMGLIRRPTALQEFGIGAAFGWGAMVACVLPIALLGGMTITFWTGPRQFGLLFLDLATLLVAALAEEVAFRGYPFQRLIEAMGPVMATMVVSVIFAAVHLSNPDATFASTLTTALAGWLLSLAYLRTRALWLPWGLHFAWNASMGILFGLPVSGLRIFSPVISTNAHGPFWLTGDGYGPEGSLITVIVLLISVGALMAVTKSYAYQYAQPVIVPGGIPVDIDAAMKRQHEEAMATPAEVATPRLVQILPASSPTHPAVVEPGSESILEGRSYPEEEPQRGAVGE
ncbi:putative metal-dependent membrane protease [Acidisarcina polymorpha]|uniref:Putative metal-dependent membrane protease n=1 Tax=Acidisarcina polymorpha TaxID=2211140 RepID=A0A2Z5FWN5_9BACT|nr:putative metal-dependent membrane protease [Acidisarcina polymorpha]